MGSARLYVKSWQVLSIKRGSYPDRKINEDNDTNIIMYIALQLVNRTRIIAFVLDDSFVS